MKKSSALLPRALLVLLLPTVLQANQEAAMTLERLHVESRDISGPVVIDATQNEKGMQQFSAQAFGRSFQLTPSQLAELGEVRFNSIQLSHTAGMPGIAPATIYVKLGMGFTSGEARSKHVLLGDDGTIVVKDQLVAPERRAVRIEPLFGAYGHVGVTSGAPTQESWYAVVVVEVESPVSTANVAASGLRLMDASGNEIMASRILSVEEFDRPRVAGEGEYAYWVNPGGTRAWDGRLPAGKIRLRIRAAFTEGQSARMRDIARFRVTVGMLVIEGKINARLPS
jgi:hypothetical protein